MLGLFFGRLMLWVWGILGAYRLSINRGAFLCPWRGLRGSFYRPYICTDTG